MTQANEQPNGVVPRQVAIGATGAQAPVQATDAAPARASEAAPLVSVLVPVFNAERYVAQALESVRAQTLENLEVLCINDGSTDGSRDIIDAFVRADARFLLIDKPNSGYGASMNLGIRQATGRYIAILESDDLYEPDALEKLVTVAEAQGADVVKGDYWFFWSQPRQRQLPAGQIAPAMTGHVFAPVDEPAIFFINPTVWTAVYRRTFLLEHGLWMLETPGASFQDLGFTFKVFASTRRMCCIADPLVHYRQDNEASSINNPQKVYCVCDEFDSVRQFIDADPSRARLRPFLLRLRYDSYMWNFERLTPALRAQFLDRMLDDLASGVLDGDFEASLFEPHQLANLNYLLANPQRFLARFPEKPTRLAKTFYYAGISARAALGRAFGRLGRIARL